MRLWELLAQQGSSPGVLRDAGSERGASDRVRLVGSTRQLRGDPLPSCWSGWFFRPQRRAWGVWAERVEVPSGSCEPQKGPFVPVAGPSSCPLRGGDICQAAAGALPPALPLLCDPRDGRHLPRSAQSRPQSGPARRVARGDRTGERKGTEARRGDGGEQRLPCLAAVPAPVACYPPGGPAARRSPRSAAMRPPQPPVECARPQSTRLAPHGAR